MATLAHFRAGCQIRAATDQANISGGWISESLLRLARPESLARKARAGEELLAFVRGNFRRTMIPGLLPSVSNVPLTSRVPARSPHRGSNLAPRRSSSHHHPSRDNCD